MTEPSKEIDVVELLVACNGQTWDDDPITYEAGERGTVILAMGDLREVEFGAGPGPRDGSAVCRDSELRVVRKYVPDE